MALVCISLFLWLAYIFLLIYEKFLHVKDTDSLSVSSVTNLFPRMEFVFRFYDAFISFLLPPSLPSFLPSFFLHIEVLHFYAIIFVHALAFYFCVIFRERSVSF